MFPHNLIFNDGTVSYFIDNAIICLTYFWVFGFFPIHYYE